MAKTMKVAPPREDVVEFFDAEECPQGGERWHEVRMGLPTASVFSVIMASGKDGGESKTRADLLYALAGEQLTGTADEGFVSEAMRRGVEMEAELREQYARSTFEPVEQIGFIKRTIPNPLGTEDLVVGGSPDALVGKWKILEIKTMKPTLLIPLLERGAAGFPARHRAQCQGNLWISGRDVCDLRIGYRGMPTMARFTIERDDVYIKQIRDAVEVFSYDLRRLVEKIRAMGGKP